MENQPKRKMPDGEYLRRRIWSQGKDPKGCTHRNQIRDVTPASEGCAQCLEMGDTWVHLRMCLTCGHVGCCDNSKNKHATRHHAETDHPIVRSFEPGEDWRWCYVDGVILPPD